MRPFDGVAPELPFSRAKARYYDGLLIQFLSKLTQERTKSPGVFAGLEAYPDHPESSRKEKQETPRHLSNEISQLRDQDFGTLGSEEAPRGLGSGLILISLGIGVLPDAVHPLVVQAEALG